MSFYRGRLLSIPEKVSLKDIENQTVNQDLFAILDWLPASFVDLLFVDPPYNLTKSFNSGTFRERSLEEYSEWFESWFSGLLRPALPLSRSAFR